jgi:hypothetical protein
MFGLLEVKIELQTASFLDSCKQLQLGELLHDDMFGLFKVKIELQPISFFDSYKQLQLGELLHVRPFRGKY